MNQSTVSQMLTSFFDRLDKNEKAKTELKRYDRVIHFHVTDGRDVTVTARGGDVSVVPGKKDKPDLQMRADTATYAAVLEGRMTPGKAWWDKKLWLGSDIAGWVDTSKPDYPWFTRILHWFAPGPDK